MAENFLYDILVGGAVFSLICIAVVAICFHMIFRPDYRPGLNTMPFLWYPLLRFIYGYSKKNIAAPATYVVNSVLGMCHVLYHQKLLSYTICGRSYVFLFRAETAEVVLSSNKLIEKSRDYGRDLLKDGLVLSHGDKWRHRRKLLTSTFHFKILQDFLPSVNEQANKVVLKLLASVNEPWIDIYELMKQCSWNMFLKTAVGVEVDTESEEAKICHEAMKEFHECMVLRATRPWLYINAVYKLSSISKRASICIDAVHSYMRKVISEKKKKVLSSRIHTHGVVKTNGYSDLNGDIGKNNYITSGKNERKAFMDLLLELHLENETFSEEDILEECLTFFLGATATMTKSLAYFFYSIGLYKDVQKKVHDELDGIFKGSNRDITKEDLRAMKYTECVIKESNRLYPLNFISRTATESFKIGDYTVPLGSVVVIFLEMIHRDPEFFPNPEKFDPTRFSSENSFGKNPYAFIPFSAGPRNCIAQKFATMTIKTVVASILRTFNLSSLDERDKIHVNCKTHTQDQLRLRLLPRNISCMT